MNDISKRVLGALESEILRHTLGLNYKRTPFRNYFFADESGPDFDAIQGLVSSGLMKPGRKRDDGRYYHVTKLGAEAIGFEGEIPNF